LCKQKLLKFINILVDDGLTYIGYMVWSMLPYQFK
jgi:hypothetical protein